MPFKLLRWPNSLRSRVLAVLVASMVASAVLVSVTANVLWDPFTRWALRDQIDDNATSLVKHLQFDSQGRPVGLNPDKIEPWLFENLHTEVLLRVISADGRIVLANDEGAEVLAPDGQAFAASHDSFTFHRKGVAMHGATVPFVRNGQSWVLQFAVTDRMVLRMRQSIGFDVLRQGVVALCTTFVLVFLVLIHSALKQALSPVRAASAAARRIAPRTLDERLSTVDQPKELRPLVEGFNQALDRLEHGFRTQQEFLSNAAHELKTPLALIRAQVELGAEGNGRDQVLGDVDRVARQVQQLLLLAEASEQQNYKMEPIAPRAAVREVLDLIERVATNHGVTLGLQFSPSLNLWQADRGGLFTLLKNVLENAIQHSPRDGLVKLVVSSDGFSVSDEGPGVDEQDLERIFERFWRGPARREKGAGLGLAICAEIASAHGWVLSARRLSPGLKVECTMVRGHA